MFDNGAVPDFRGVRSPPVAYLIRCVRFAGVVQSYDLRPPRNTRYGWLAKPCPTGTFTLQEAPSFAWRTNDQLSGTNCTNVVLAVRTVQVHVAAAESDEPRRRRRTFIFRSPYIRTPYPKLSSIKQRIEKQIV